MNIYDVPGHAGVSVATVSRVLNGSPNVSEKAREKVLKAMDELGYTPSVFARGPGLNTMKTIGIMCSGSSDPYLAGVVCYLERGLRAHGYDAIPYCTGYNLDAKQKYFDLFRSERVDTIVLAGSRFVEMRAKGSTYIIEAASDLPIMPVNGFPEDENIYSTVCDDHAAVYDAANQPLSSRRRRVLYIYTSCSYSGVNKLEGYRDVLKAKGTTPSDELIRQYPKNIEAARELLLSFHGGGLEFDTIIASDGSLAVGAVKYAHIVDISIPRDLSIIGYNNSLLARCTDPKITSIGSKVEALCTTAINTLVGIFSDVNMPNRATIASDLIERKTTNL